MVTYSQAVRWAAEHEPNSEAIAACIAFIYDRPKGAVEARIRERDEYRIVDKRKIKR